VTWWTWTILWVALVLFGALALFLAGRRLYRQGMALARELGAASDTLAEVTGALHREDPSPPATP
jgi:ADP-ribosylglycohydrolase